MTKLEKRNIGYAVTAFIAIIVVLLALFCSKKFSLTVLMPAIGLLVFFGMLIIVNLFSPETELKKGEIRKAIAASLLAVYFFIIAISLFSTVSPIYRIPPSNPTEIQDSKETLSSYDAEEPQPESEGEEAVESTTVNDMRNQLLKDFTKLMMLVVSFYFGGRAAVDGIQAWRKPIEGVGTKKGVENKIS